MYQVKTYRDCKKAFFTRRYVTHCAGTVPEMCRLGARSVPVRYQKCAGWVPEVCRYGTRSVPVRYQKCVGWVPEVCRYGTRSVPVRYKTCAGTVPEVTDRDNGTCGRSGSNFTNTRRTGGCSFISRTENENKCRQNLNSL